MKKHIETKPIFIILGMLFVAMFIPGCSSKTCYIKDVVEHKDELPTSIIYTSSADNNIRIYNFYNNSTTLTQKSSFESFVDSDKFIVGYQVARVRNNSDLEEPQ